VELAYCSHKIVELHRRPTPTLVVRGPAELPLAVSETAEKDDKEVGQLAFRHHLYQLGYAITYLSNSPQVFFVTSVRVATVVFKTQCLLVDQV
jgi:hypothetical protein